MLEWILGGSNSNSSNVVVIVIIMITTKRRGSSIGVGDLRSTTTMQTLHVISIEQPTAFHTISLSLIKVMYLCLWVYVNKCIFFRQVGVALWLEPCRRCAVSGLLATVFSLGAWSRWAGLPLPFAPGVSYTLSCQARWWDLFHLVPLITHKSSFCFIPCMSEVVALISLFLLHFWFKHTILS